MRRLLAPAALGLTLCALPPATSAQIGPLRLDGVAATVGGRSPGATVTTILRSDVELRARLKLSGRHDGGLRVELSPALLSATLSEMIGEFLIVREARRIRSVAPGKADVRVELSRLHEAAGGSERVAKLLAHLSADPTELARIARRRAAVAAFLRSNLEGATVVTEAEIDTVISQRSTEGVPLARAREVVRSQLWRKALDRSIAHWVRVLRARTVVKVHADFTPS